MNRLTLGAGALTLIVASVLPDPAGASEDARSILEKMQQVQIERWEGVNSYYVDQTIMGNRSVTYFERDIVMDDNGNVVPYFRMVPFSELEQRQAKGQGFSGMSAEDLEAMAGAYQVTGDALGEGIEQGLEDAGLPRGMLAASGSDPNATLDPRVMMGRNADALKQMADGKREADAESANPMQDMSALVERATVVGKESIGGRSVWYLRVDDLDELDTAQSDEVVMHTSHIWIDSEMYVPLLFKIEGDMTSEGKTRPVTLEREARDYRTVPGSSMYESYSSTMRMAGTLTPEQQVEMQNAQKQMADLEQQLASMPESQRSMIMQRMGPQLAMMRQMAAGGGMEFTTEVHEIKVNPTALPNVASMSGLGAPGGVLPAAGPTPAAPAQQAPAVPAAGGSDQALADAQKACLEEKMQAAQEAQQKKRGFGRLMGAVARTAGRFGGQDLGRVAGDVYSANATADDVANAAKDLGLTQSDIDDCRQPGLAPE